jgi:hypothetical protein
VELWDAYGAKSEFRGKGWKPPVYLGFTDFRLSIEPSFSGDG